MLFREVMQLRQQKTLLLAGAVGVGGSASGAAAARLRATGQRCSSCHGKRRASLNKRGTSIVSFLQVVVDEEQSGKSDSDFKIKF